MQTVVSRGCVDPLTQARAIAERGFHAIYQGEHHHLPVATPVPEFYKETGVPEFYKYTPDPLITLGMMHAVAPSLEVGTSILLLPIHDTLMAASRMGTLDVLTGGKASFGLGIGWNQPELAHHGVQFETRLAKLEEQLRAIRKLWSSEITSFDGEFVKFAESWQGPKPLQQPRPPLLMGGRLLKRNRRIIAELCDGWLPTDTYARSYGEHIEADIATLGDALEEQGRDRTALKNAFLYSELFLWDRSPEDFAKAAPTRTDIARYEALGFDRVILGVPTFSDAHFHGALDVITKVAEPWLAQR